MADLFSQSLDEELERLKALPEYPKPNLYFEVASRYEVLHELWAEKGWPPEEIVKQLSFEISPLQLAKLINAVTDERYKARRAKRKSSSLKQLF